MKKRLLAAVLCLCMAVSLLPMSALAAGTTSGTGVESHAVTGGNIYYKVTGEAASVVGCDDTVTSVTIPATLGGKPVTTIGNHAFLSAGLESLTLPASVTSIGESAFSQCEALVTADLSACADLVALGTSAFRSDYKLETVTLPTSENFTTIGDSAFVGCDLLTFITIPGSVTTIGDSAFSGAGLTAVTLPAGLVSLGKSAFASTPLANVTFAAGCEIETIGERVFFETDLSSVTLPASVTSIGNWAFQGCASLASVSFSSPEKLKTIGNYAFYETKLTSLSLPASLESIGISAFQKVEELSAVNFSQLTKLKTIGDTAFSRTGLTAVTLSDSVTDIGQSAFSYCDKLETLRLPPAVETIDNYAFSECTSLKAVNLGALTALESLSSSVFSYTALESVTIPACVTTIGGGAFSHCASLTSVTFAEGSTLETIGSSVFSQTGLTSIVLPALLESLGENAFAFCDSLVSVDMSKLTALDTIQQGTFKGTALTAVSIPACVEWIEDAAFMNCKELASVTFAEGSALTAIGGHNTNYSDGNGGFELRLVESADGAFDGCDKLNGITLPDTVTAVRQSAFERCKALTAIALPANLTTLGVDAFQDCGALASVTWPNNPGFTTVNGFAGCLLLGSEVYNALPTSVTTIGESAFANWNITALTIPAHIRSIEKDAFYFCEATSLTIMPGVESIGIGAFSYCAGLKGKTITIPNTVQSVSTYAFSLGGYEENQPTTTFVFLNPDTKFENPMSSYPNVYVVNPANSAEKIADPFDITGVDIVLQGYAKNSEDGDSDVYKYSQWCNGTTHKDYSTLTYSCPFTELTSITKYTVSGTVPEGAVVKLTRGGAPVSVTQTGTNFTAEVQNGAEVRLSVSRDGYYSEYRVRAAAEFTANWALGTITLTALPTAGRLYAAITCNGTPLTSFEGLDLTLKKNNAALTATTDYTVVYPYIILNDPATVLPTDALTLTVTPAADLRMSSGEATLNRAKSSFSVALEPWGHITATTTGGFAGQNKVLIFDSDGALMEQGLTTDGAYSSNRLPAGIYTVVAFNKNSLFSSVSTLSALDTLGLTANTDYANSSVAVADGAAAAAALSVPLLNTASLSSILDTASCCVTVEEPQPISGLAFNVRVFYALKSPGSGTVKITLPGDAEVTGVYSDTEYLSATPVDNVLTLDTSDQSGVFYVRMSVSGPGAHSISAAMTSNDVTAPIGSASFDTAALRISVPDEYLTVKSGSVNIIAAPKTLVKLYADDGAEPLTSGTTNFCGRLTLTYTLPGVLPGQTVTLQARNADGSASQNVTYLPGSTAVTDFSFVTAGHEYHLVSRESGNVSDYYIYRALPDEKSHWWSFAATIECGSELADEDVTLYLTMLDGSLRSVPMTQLSMAEASGAYTYQFAAELYLKPAGDHVFDASLIPTGFALDYDYAAKEFALDPAERGQILADTTAKTAARQAEQKQALDEIDAAYFTDDPATVDVDESLIITAEDPEAFELIFNHGYVVSDEGWFVALGETPQGQELQADLLFAEETTAEMMENMGDVLGLENSLDEYSGWDEVCDELGLSAEPGVPITEANRASFEEQGYEVHETGDGKYYALKTEEYDAENSDDPVGFAFVDTEGNIVDVDFKGEALGNSLTAARNNSIGWIGEAAKASNVRILNLMRKSKAFTAPELHRTARSFRIINKSMTGVSAVLGYYSAQSDISDYENALDRAAQIEGYIENLKMFEKRYETIDIPCATSIMLERHAAENLLVYVKAQGNHALTNLVVGTVFTAMGVAGTGGLAAPVLNGAYDLASNMVGSARAAKITELMQELNARALDRYEDCGETDMEQIKARLNAYTSTPILDPSGNVYEAVPGNTLSGVEATIWYDADTDHTSGVTKWDASGYDQLNPQTTGADGAYAWDVPSGWWQVRFTKDGYTPTQTAWMQVPPPRMNLTTAMVSTAAPAVESAKAYPDYIEVIFSQYMDKSATLTLPEGMTGEWQGTETYSKVLRITKVGGFTLGSTVNLTLSGAKNYAGTALPAYSGNLAVTARPAEIVLNYDSTIAMTAGTTPSVTVRVKDTEGNYMEGVTVNAAVGNALLATIAASAATDADGKAVFAASALLPGLTDVTFSVDGTALTKTADLRVTVEAMRPARPTAVVGSTSLTAASPKENYVTVASGTMLTLSAEAGVTIYYTTDDTCPCQNSASRQVYTGPVSIAENTYFRIAAYKDGLQYSERLNITVTVTDGGGGGSGGGGGGGLPVSHTLRFQTNGGSAIDDLRVNMGAEIDPADYATSLEGYVFSGWYLDEALTKPAEAFKVTKDAVLYAKWSPIMLFSDISQNDWFYGDVKYVFENGLMQGTGGTFFSPHLETTRGMIVTILHRLEGEPNASAENPFDDVKSGKYYEEAVMWAAENKIINGYSDGRFGPEDSITREQMATILYRYASFKKYDVTAAAVLTKFQDNNLISSYALTPLAWANAEGLINGVSGNLIDPVGFAERAQVAAMLHRFCENIVK